MPDDPKKPETKTAVADPVPAKPVLPGEPDPAEMKSKETIPGGLYIVDGHYVNANGDFVDKTGKKTEVVDKDGNVVQKPVKAAKGETPVQDHQKKLETEVEQKPEPELV